MLPPPDEFPDTYWRVSVKALILDGDRLLVFKDKNNEWEIPGGGWNHNETMEACLSRELGEEVRASIVHIGEITFCYRGKNAEGYPKLSIAVRVELKPTELLPSGDDLVETRFVTKEEFLHLPFQAGESSVLNYVDQIWTD